MRKILALCLITAFAAPLSAQNQNLKQKTLFTVEDDTITAGEYMAVYNKNRDVGKDIDPKTPLEYLDLYINFKLKVHKAKELGRDKLPGFLNEYQSYREQLAEPYLSDNAVTEELVREAYQRQKEDVRASHIMVAVQPNALPKDTLEAYNRAMEIRKTIVNGADFAKVAQESSADTYSAKRGGDLGYFTAFDMVYPFESAAYNTPVGEISQPVRSQYGYHLVKPTDRRPARGTAHVAHIMIVDNEKKSAEESENAKARIDEIYAKLQAGEDFATLAKQYSEDKTSAIQGGVLQPFGINKMYPEFEEAAFALKEKGEISEPIKTPVGWHIITLIKEPKKQSFAESKAALQNEVERDARALQSRESVIKTIKSDYAYKEYPSRLPLAFEQVGEELFSSAFKAQDVKNADKVLFEFAEKQYTVQDFLEFVENNQRSYASSSDLEASMFKAYDDFSEGELVAYEKSRLPEKYPEFRLLDREYYEGILLFDLTDEMVWKKALRDTTGLAEFYQKNKENYRWEKRYQVVLIDADTKKAAKNAKKQLKKGAEMEEVLTQLNQESKLSLALDSGVYEVSDLELLKKYKEEDLEEGFTDVVEENGRYKLMQILKIMEPSVKPLEDAKGKVISDYQEYLEKEWIKSLKAEYEVRVNEAVLDQVVEELD